MPHSVNRPMGTDQITLEHGDDVVPHGRPGQGRTIRTFGYAMATMVDGQTLVPIREQRCHGFPDVAMKSGGMGEQEDGSIWTRSTEIVNGNSHPARASNQRVRRIGPLDITRWIHAIGDAMCTVWIPLAEGRAGAMQGQATSDLRTLSASSSLDGVTEETANHMLAAVPAARAGQTRNAG
jgi:hypothetical protein